jgi:hypothetical protein
MTPLPRPYAAQTQAQAPCLHCGDEKGRTPWGYLGHGNALNVSSASVTPPPREALAGVELAHIFDTGWAIGKICSKIKRHLACLVPRQWLHKLDIEMYGEDKFWVIVERTSGSATPQESPLVHAMSTEQLHARANTLQQQIEHAETQQRERQKERESARDRGRGRGRG